MFAARTVIHRYTPPTCTLEISAQSSPLSLWVQRPVLRELAFLLRFDDPRLPEAEQVTIRGNAAQLESLWEAVSVYVQSLLVAPPQLPCCSMAWRRDCLSRTNSLIPWRFCRRLPV
ncbi:MAG: DUF4335 domain-containing protein [Chloroflexaceae bacterium]|nr:DUF4335 domain-containing protein [Chloroflexaceae bacterium]